MTARSYAARDGAHILPRHLLWAAGVALIASATLLPPAHTAAAAPAPSIVAQARASTVAVFPTRGAVRPSFVMRNPRADGSPVVFLVVQRVPGWDKVLLAQRPNGSAGWVRAQTVTLALDPYQVHVTLHTHRIEVLLRGRVLIRGRVANGRPSLPTPTGLFYTVELLKQIDSTGAYGPYAFGLSAFSNVLFSFGGGPGQIGIHGTNEPHLLGTSASHGCVRVANALIVRLARILPLGTPVVISP